MIDPRTQFGLQLSTNKFVTDKSGKKMLEIIGAQFLAKDPEIFGKVNLDWCEREYKWYESQSLNVNDIPAPIPAIWKMVATPDGRINSNYGWAIWSDENSSQYENCLATLQKEKESRRAIMIYTRPSMQYEYNKDGMSDFMCTNSVQYFIRDNYLSCIVNMRSNDAIHGYKGDYFWQEEVLVKLFMDLLFTYPELQCGDIIWNVGSLHIYEHHFFLVDHYNKTGETSITKERYIELYPDSEWI